jgi:hypothetical protein
VSTAAVFPGPEPESPQRALLWDLDNVEPRREHLASLARALSSAVTPEAVRLAAAHLHRYRACRAALEALGFEVASGTRRRDGADRLLLRHARLLRQQGVREFWVASNDHEFSAIANFADLHVLTLRPDYVSVRLRAAARTVTVLSGDGGNWSSLRLPCVEGGARAAGVPRSQ